LIEHLVHGGEKRTGRSMLNFPDEPVEEQCGSALGLGTAAHNPGHFGNNRVPLPRQNSCQPARILPVAEDSVLRWKHSFGDGGQQTAAGMTHHELSGEYEGLDVVLMNPPPPVLNAWLIVQDATQGFDRFLPNRVEGRTDGRQGRGDRTGHRQIVKTGD
jgi:hypothetical protein